MKWEHLLSATSQLIWQRDDKIIQQELGEIDAMDVNEEVLKIHGYSPPKRGREKSTWYTKYVNGFSNCMSNNWNVEKAKEIQDNLKVDIAAYCEYQLNMQHKQNFNGFNQLFKGGEAALKFIVAHNIHENIGRI